jgi:hypothetical protein
VLSAAAVATSAGTWGEANGFEYADASRRAAHRLNLSGLHLGNEDSLKINQLGWEAERPASVRISRDPIGPSPSLIATMARSP